MGKKSKKYGRRDDENVVSTVSYVAEPVSRVPTFTCTANGCLVTEPANEMFNLSCDPVRTTLAQIRTKVICRRCAEKISERNGRRVGEPGCGVYPLAQTLRAMEHEAEAREKPDLYPTYACKEADCTAKGRASEMFNLPCNLARTELSAIMELVRCETHAAATAKARGKAVCEPGSGVYRLSHTLRMIGAGPARTPRQQHENEYVNWYRQTVAERAEKERDAQVRDYARLYAEESSTDDLHGFRAPAPRMEPFADDDGAESLAHFCGLPLACCDHDKPASRFITALGKVVGICDVAARIFAEIVGAAGDPHRKLVAMTDISQAEELAERSRGRRRRDP